MASNTKGAESKKTSQGIGFWPADWMVSTVGISKMSFGMQTVDSLHHPLCPLNACFDDAVSNRAAVWHSEKIIGS